MHFRFRSEAMWFPEHCVLLVSMLVSFMFSKRIRTLDMVDVLKGTE